ncbi:MAG: cob(I)yrinic acid a,c-diamide adenosyltransferase [Chloroflexi bacterium]|nr:cob(I)yrinic acid a,c-diamide adenosyltransferase [Chloroflexota bacterium]
MLAKIRNRAHKGALKGLIQVYTGDGKGKTTAALGLALRTAGQGMKVIVIQFVKSDRTCGEHLFVYKYHPFDIVQLSTKSIFDQTIEELRLTAERTLAFAEETMLGGKYDMVILDEIFVAVSKGLVTTEQIENLMSKKPEVVELVLTGRGASEAIIRQADLVTEMTAVKHPLTSGITVRRGIEY